MGFLLLSLLIKQQLIDDERGLRVPIRSIGADEQIYSTVISKALMFRCRQTSLLSTDF